MKFVFFIISFLLIVPQLESCRTNREASSLTVAERHSDSVAALRSIRATLVERETVWETVTMRPDTITGELRVVARDIRKATERTTETAKTGDTARFAVSDKKTFNLESETRETQGNAATRQPMGNIALWVVCIAVPASLLVPYIYATWKSRN